MLLDKAVGKNDPVDVATGEMPRPRLTWPCPACYPWCFAVRSK
ncbi:hypothetical protein [Streptomyces sp. NPDC002082]